MNKFKEVEMEEHDLGIHASNLAEIVNKHCWHQERETEERERERKREREKSWSELGVS